MAHTRVPAVLSQLTSVATTALANSTCTVYRGPFVTSDTGDALFIGYDGDPGGDFRSVLSTSEWAGLGAKARNEEFRVFCGITCMRGDANVQSAVDDAFTIYNLFEDAVRATPSLSQAPRITVALNTGELFTLPHPSGLQIRLGFSVAVSARI